MKISAILRKLGLFRSGSVSWQGEASQRPVEALMDDVYDREKDLVQLKARSAGPVAPAAEHPKDSKGKASRKGRLLHFLSLALGFFVLFIMAAGGYFGPWFWVNLIVWFGFTRYTKKEALRLSYATGKMAGILLLVSLLSFFSLSAIPTDQAGQPDQPALDPISRVDLALALENDLGLEDVRVDVLEGGILEVRTKTPVNVSPAAIYGASAFVFAYLEPRLPRGIRDLRIILTVNDLDAMILETTRENVVKHQAGESGDDVFFKNLKTRNVGVGR